MNFAQSICPINQSDHVRPRHEESMASGKDPKEVLECLKQESLQDCERLIIQQYFHAQEMEDYAEGAKSHARTLLARKGLNAIRFESTAFQASFSEAVMAKVLPNVQGKLASEVLRRLRATTTLWMTTWTPETA